MTIDFKQLSKPFAPSDVRWRVQQVWMRGEEIGATCVPFIDNRAIMERLDEVCGPQNWRQEFSAGPDGGVLCTLSIRVDGEWIGKSDAAENTNIEAIKGGISDSMKRAAVQWGIGRYLYRLRGPFFCEVFKDRKTGMYYQPASKDKKLPEFSWNPPRVVLGDSGPELSTGKPKEEKPPKLPASNDSASVYSKASAAIKNAHTVKSVRQCLARAAEHAGEGNLTADEMNALEALSEQRIELLTPQGAAS